MTRFGSGMAPTQRAILYLLPGPVTALWAAETGREVTLVVHNLQTGQYEASRLGLACAQ
jgi:hypothetical protein